MADEKADTKEETKEVEVPKQFKELVKTIEEMSVLELSELVKVLEDKFGVSAAAPVALAVADAAATEDEGESSAEKSAYNIELTAAGQQKIAVIKAVRVVTELGLKDAKDLVDKAPTTVKENVPKDEAEEIQKKLEEADATVELK